LTQCTERSIVEGDEFASRRSKGIDGQLIRRQNTRSEVGCNVGGGPARKIARHTLTRGEVRTDTSLSKEYGLSRHIIGNAGDGSACLIGRPSSARGCVVDHASQTLRYRGNS
jgi:hypothetical protein